MGTAKDAKSAKIGKEFQHGKHGIHGKDKHRPEPPPPRRGSLKKYCKTKTRAVPNQGSSQKCFLFCNIFSEREPAASGGCSAPWPPCSPWLNPQRLCGEILRSCGRRWCQMRDRRWCRRVREMWRSWRPACGGTPPQIPDTCAHLMADAAAHATHR